MTRPRLHAFGWRLFGLLLLAGAWAPLHRLLTEERGGVPAARMRVEAETLQSASWTGTLVALAVAAFVVVFVGVRSRSGETGGLERARRWESATARGLTAISPRAWIAGCGVVAGAAAGAVHHFLLSGA